MYDRVSGFNKFWSSEKNTENMMSHLYFNEESDYPEQSICDSEDFCTTVLQHWKELNIITI